MSKLKRVVPWRSADDDDDDGDMLLKLERDGGVTRIVAANTHGERLNAGRLLRLGPDGLERVCNVDPDLGFPLDENGRIKLDEG